MFSYAVVLTFAASIGLDNFSYLIGLVLGYGICLINFRFHIMVIDALLVTMTKRSMILVITSRAIPNAILCIWLASGDIHARDVQPGHCGYWLHVYQGGYL